MSNLSTRSSKALTRDLKWARIQKADPGDRVKIRSLLEGTGVFNCAEIDCALSLFDVYIEKGPDPNEYVFNCAYDEHSNVLGFICFGKVPLTDRVYDLYWVATDPGVQKHGIGGLLMEDLDRSLGELSARMLMAETSSRPEYAKARQFYLRRGFEKVSMIQDYYSVGDDLLVFQKKFSSKLDL